jgi:hypothetical protein
MTIGTDDIYHPSASVQTAEDYTYLAAFIAIYVIINYVVMLLCKGRLLEFNTTTWRFSILMVGWFGARHLITIFLLYTDCPKVVSLINAIMGGIGCILFVLGLSHILTLGFCNASKILTPRNIRIFQYFYVIFQFVMIGPYYYLLIRYSFVPTPFSIRNFQLMYQIFFIFTYVYVLWQYL